MVGVGCLLLFSCCIEYEEGAFKATGRALGRSAEILPGPCIGHASGCSVSDCKKGQMGERTTDEPNRSRSQEADSDVCRSFTGESSQGGEGGIGQRQALNSGAVLTWSQPGKLESQVALQMSQIKARGHRTLHPSWGSH